MYNRSSLCEGSSDGFQGSAKQLNLNDEDILVHDNISSDLSTICSLCSSSLTIFDAETGEVVCSNCGMVIYDNMQSLEAEWRIHKFEDIKLKERTGMPTSLAIHDMGLSTFISYSNVDANGTALSQEQINKVRAMRRWNRISTYNNNKSARNLNNAFEIMSRIKDKLSLTDPVTEKAAYYYRKALDKNLIKGRSIEGMVIASVYVACRELSVPRTLDEISTVINSDLTFVSKCYRLLVRHLKLQSLPVVLTSSYLSKIASKAEVSERTYRRALEMLARVNEDHMAIGKHPNALAVAVLYAACIREGERITQEQMAIAAGTSMVTLRKRFADIKKMFYML
jgi:transcription initiation factor TFIIB